MFENGHRHAGHPVMRWERTQECRPHSDEMRTDTGMQATQWWDENGQRNAGHTVMRWERSQECRPHSDEFLLCVFDLVMTISKELIWHLSIFHKTVSLFSLIWLWTHARIRSWNQPLLTNVYSVCNASLLIYLSKAHICSISSLKCILSESNSFITWFNRNIYTV